MLLTENRDLLDAYRRGESHALEKIYHHYAERVEELLRHGFTFKSGGESYRFTGYESAFELQDALQKTFVKAFGESARENYCGTRPFGPYLMTIARNLVIDEFRRRSREMSLFIPENGGRETSLDTAAEATLPHSPVGEWTREGQDPEEATRRRKLASLLSEFMETLDEESLTLVRRRFIERRSQRETSELMGIDRNRVRKLTRELRLDLLLFMKDRGQISQLDPEQLLVQLGVALASVSATVI